MADIVMPAGNSRRRISLQRCKKLSTKVDLTPMVDLGFLLITFFIVTTTWSKPRVTVLNMPANGDSTNLGKEASLTILAVRGNKIFYYQGTLDESLHEGSFGISGYSVKSGIGEVIRQKQLAMDKYYKGGRRELMLLIKPTKEATYENIVKLLDETMINVVIRYAIMDVTKEELNTLHDHHLID